MTHQAHDTDSRRQSPERLRDADHDRGLHEVTATITALTQPVTGILRVTAKLSTSADDPVWSHPNVAFRIHLGADDDNASRIYTVRSYNAVAGAFTFDIVLHPHDSPMMQWADRARLGDVFQLTGPRPQFGVPATPGSKIALFLDETAIPALYAILQQWPQGVTGVGWVCTDHADAFAELPTVPGLQLQRIGTESDAPLAERATKLADPAQYVVWGAGERDEMRSIRQHFRNVVGLGKEQVQVAGYWKRGASNTDIDSHRRVHYEALIARGGTLADFDDLAIGI